MRFGEDLLLGALPPLVLPCCARHRDGHSSQEAAGSKGWVPRRGCWPHREPGWAPNGHPPSNSRTPGGVAEAHPGRHPRAAALPPPARVAFPKGWRETSLPLTLASGLTQRPSRHRPGDAAARLSASGLQLGAAAPWSVSGLRRDLSGAGAEPGPAETWGPARPRRPRRPRRARPGLSLRGRARGAGGPAQSPRGAAIGRGGRGRRSLRGRAAPAGMNGARAPRPQPPERGAQRGGRESGR